MSRPRLHRVWVSEGQLQKARARSLKFCLFSGLSVLNVDFALIPIKAKSTVGFQSLHFNLRIRVSGLGGLEAGQEFEIS